MMYELNSNKKVRIPDEIIEKYIKAFGFTRDEAIQLFLEEEGHLTNEEMEELDKKASKVKIDHDAMSEEVIERKFKYDKTKEKTQKERVRKPNNDKAAIISMLVEALEGNVENLNIENAEKIVKFEMNGKKFTINLVQNRG